MAPIDKSNELNNSRRLCSVTKKRTRDFSPDKDVPNEKLAKLDAGFPFQEEPQTNSKPRAKKKKKAFESIITKMSNYHPFSHHPNSYGNNVTNGGHSYKNMTAEQNGSKFTSTSASTISSSLPSSKSPSIASLCNLGNTCFLNSVLYTLRFTPGFLHNLHHMFVDLQEGYANGGKKKTGLTNGFSNGVSDHADGNGETEMAHRDVVEQLHDLFKTLSTADSSSDSKDPIPPSNFLSAVGKLNPLFEGNQQQDAHELLVMILNSLEDIKIPIRVQDKSDVVEAPLPPPVPDKKGKRSKGSKLLPNGNGSLSNGINGTNSRSSSPLPGSTVKSQQQSQPPNNATLPNFVKDNFEGKSVMRTRCLECEMSTYRSETFTFIDVPLHLDDDDDELSGKELFLKQILMSETLRENNKYWCEECSRLNEAQRSVQYELLPRVMVLQLKRFTASGSKYVSKINDYIPTPFIMNCFCNECMPPQPHHQQHRQQAPEKKHHYRLYAVIMHLGATLASGHYIAYVRASSDFMSSWDHHGQCQRISTVERNKKKKGIMKFLQRGNNNNSDPPATGVNSVNGVDAVQSCRSVNCCGIKGSLGDMSPNSQRSSSVDSNCYSDHVGDDLDGIDDSDYWLECDDESIQLITRKHFEDILSAKHGASTPYLLFYQRV